MEIVMKKTVIFLLTLIASNSFAQNEHEFRKSTINAKCTGYIESYIESDNSESFEINFEGNLSGMTGAGGMQALHVGRGNLSEQRLYLINLGDRARLSFAPNLRTQTEKNEIESQINLPKAGESKLFLKYSLDSNNVKRAVDVSCVIQIVN
jgi:hypothetical protein